MTCRFSCRPLEWKRSRLESGQASPHIRVSGRRILLPLAHARHTQPLALTRRYPVATSLATTMTGRKRRVSHPATLSRPEGHKKGASVSPPVSPNKLAHRFARHAFHGHTGRCRLRRYARTPPPSCVQAQVAHSTRPCRHGAGPDLLRASGVQRVAGRAAAGVGPGSLRMRSQPCRPRARHPVSGRVALRGRRRGCEVRWRQSGVLGSYVGLTSHTSAPAHLQCRQ